MEACKIWCLSIYVYLFINWLDLMSSNHLNKRETSFIPVIELKKQLTHQIQLIQTPKQQYKCKKWNAPCAQHS